MQVLAAAVALPVQQLVLCARPLVGRWAESFFWGDGVALILVLLGFGVYQLLSPEGRAARGRGQTQPPQSSAPREDEGGRWQGGRMCEPLVPPSSWT